MSLILFNGNNEAYLNSIEGRVEMLSNWTTCPVDALKHGYNTARNYNSKMSVVVLTEAPAKKFQKVDLNLLCMGCNLEWYKLDGPLNKREINRVKIYSEAELADFLNAYVKGEHLDSLQAFQVIYEKASGKKVSTPRYELRG